LGRGGQGVVYHARQAVTNREVALKVILSGSLAHPGERARFLTEVQAISRLNHPHIVSIFEVHEWEGKPYFSMEYAPGGSLADRCRVAPLAAGPAAQLVETLARAVQVVHQQGIVHRDLKPANVLFGADDRPKISDFGLAKKLDDPAGPTPSVAVMGTPSYMAPEQARGQSKQVGPAADVYALGAILYECLTSRPPFVAATNWDTVRLVLHEEPVRPRLLQPGVPRDLETICLKCLHKEPQQRYAGAEE